VKKKFEQAARRFNFTPREREIASALASAKSPKEIAGELGISYWTVRFHVRGIYRKMGAHFPAQFFFRLYQS